ncbi:transposase [Falsiroseomonas sp.]|uniref:transposase n=1 Tax=Falsiroseomonas sp. TaxID=2870721 RepID=UPI0035633B41
MTDAEWDALAPLVTHADQCRPGRPPADPRRLWNAIFWVACSHGAWHHLPAELGRADTAHRALRRHLEAGLLDRLLVAISPHPLAAAELAPLAWRIARAWRRVARLASMAQLMLARRLGLASALPCAPEDLPKPYLSEFAKRLAAHVRGAGPILLGFLAALHHEAMGRRHAWRLTDAPARS